MHPPSILYPDKKSVDELLESVKDGLGFLLLRNAAGCGNIEIVKIIEPLIDCSRDNFNALILAAEYGCTECVKILMGKDKIQTQSLENARKNALTKAAEKGHLHCIRALLQVFIPENKSYTALRVAASKGFVSCVEELIHVNKNQEDFNVALQQASRNGHVQCVKLLLPYADAKDEQSYPLRAAAFIKNAELIRLLLPYSDILEAYNYLKGIGFDESLALIKSISEELDLTFSYPKNVCKPSIKTI